VRALYGLVGIVATMCSLGPLLTAIRVLRAALVRRGGARYLRLVLLHRRARVRVSVSSLLAVRDTHGRWLMNLTTRRGDGQDYWGPIGGVVKYYPSAHGQLLSLGADLHLSEAPDSDMEQDLRVVLPVRRLRKFLEWHGSGRSREPAELSLVREISEELGQQGVADSSWLRWGCPAVSVWRAGRPMIFKDPDVTDLWHYRLFSVFTREEPDCSRLIQAVARLEHNRTLGLLPSQAINQGNFDGVLVGNHAEYLLRDRPRRGAATMYAQHTLQDSITSRA
jgi:hypothetical protein